MRRNSADHGSPLNNYLTINRDLRKKNAQELDDLAKQSRPEFLWTQSFLASGKRQGNVVVRRPAEPISTGGKEIDRQDHLGFDLAVTRRTPGDRLRTAALWSWRSISEFTEMPSLSTTDTA